MSDDLVPIDLLPEPEAESSTGPSGGQRVLVLALSIAALLGAGGFALAYLLPNANTPEDAVRALVTAVTDEDVLGALDALAPSERDLLRDTVVDVVDELRRLEVLGDDADLSGVDGIDLEVDDLELTSQTLGEGVSLVTLRGSARFEVDPSALPVGAFVDEEADESLGDEEFSNAAPLDLQLVAIEEDGRWYVSLFYSLADLARRSAGEPVPNFAAGVSPAGESSPEAAVRALVDAGVGLDGRRAIALLPPDEAAALQDYAPLFLDDLEEAAAEQRASLSVSVRSLELSSDRSGSSSEATVSVEGFSVEAVVDDERTAFSYDGRCVTVASSGEEPEEMCEGFGGMAGSLVLPFAVAGSEDEPALGDAPMTLSFVTVERGGKWYVSPLRTLLRPMVEGLRALSPGDLEDLADGFWSPAPMDGEVTSTPGGLLPDRLVQAQLRNGLTAFKVAFIDAGAWPTDPSVLTEIEPSLAFEAFGGFVVPGVVYFSVDGPVVQLVGRGTSGCFYLADDGSTVSYAADAGCGPPAAQSYGPSW